LIRYIRLIKEGIINLIKWFPVIWKDRWWDDHYIFVILQFKLSDMEKKYRKDSIHLYKDHTADKMKLCVMLLNRIIKDDYLENALMFHNKKWGDLRIITTPTEGSRTCSLEFRSENATGETQIKEENKARMKWYEHSENQKNQDIDMLFNKMAKHIQGWWD